MSEEYIKKSDAIAGFESWKSKKNSAEENFFLCGAKEVIQSIPAADVEPVVRGEWIEEGFKHSRENWDVEYKCSACGKVRYSTSNYCPNCGAKMK